MAHSRSDSQKTKRASFGVRADGRTPSDARSLESLSAATLSLISIPLPYVTVGSASSFRQCLRAASVKTHCSVAATCLPTSHTAVLRAGLPVPFAGPAVQTTTPLSPQVFFRPESHSARLQLLSLRFSPPFHCYPKGATYRRGAHSLRTISLEGVTACDSHLWIFTPQFAAAAYVSPLNEC